MFSKATVGSRLRPKSAAAPAGLFEYTLGVESVLPMVSHDAVLSLPVWPIIMSKHDVIHKAGSTWHISTPPRNKPSDGYILYA